MMEMGRTEHAVIRGEDVVKNLNWKNRRRGFVLLTVVLVAALLIVSATMFTAQLAVESRITKTDAVFKSALSLAEAGLNTVLSDISNNADTEVWARRFEGGGYSVPIAPNTIAHGTTGITVDVVGEPVSTGNPENPDQWTAEIELTAIGVVFPPSVVTADMPTSSDYMARRAVLTRAQATWTFRDAQTHVHPEDAHWDLTTNSVGYGVFTGGAFSTQGAAKEIHGDIYAGGLATIKKDSIVDGIVYSSGGLAGKPPDGSIGDLPKKGFPYVDVSYYRDLFTAYVNGTFPYDSPNNQIPGTGTDAVTNPVARYTCTAQNGAFVIEGAINRAIYGVDALRTLTTEWIDPLTSKVYRVIPSTNATASLAYMTNSTAAYFVFGDLHISSSTTLTGSIVVDGAIRVNGSADINAGIKMPALMATGDFVKNNGNAEIHGLVYTEGSFTGRGTANIEGALYAFGEVSMSGTMDIEYDSSIAGIVTGATWHVVTAAEEHTSEPYYRMDYLERVAPGGRVWVEVAPGS
jgi:hypothetical protein